MSGGNDIKNDLTLDVSEFEQNLERASKKLDKFEKKIDTTDKSSKKMEDGFKNLTSELSKTTSKIGNAADSVDKLASKLTQAQSASARTVSSSKKIQETLSQLSKEATVSEKAISTLSQWTKHYGASLDALRPKLDAISKSRKSSATVTEETTKSEARSIQNGINNRLKALAEERRIGAEQVRTREQMLRQLEQLERRQAQREADAMNKAYKVNANGQTVQRYVGRNIAKHNELMAEVNAAKEEARLIQAQRASIQEIVGDLKQRNAQLGKAIDSERELLHSNKESLRLAQAKKQAVKDEILENKRLAEQKRKASAEEKIKAREVAQAKKQAEREAANEAKRLAREVAQAKKQAEREVARVKKEQHYEAMRLAREEARNSQQLSGDILSLGAGAGVGMGLGAGVREGGRYQDVVDRVRSWNFSNDENQEIYNRAFQLSKDTKFLSKTDAIQANLDVIAGLGHNDPEFIDKTIKAAVENAYILKSKGYDKSEISDITKNLIGVIEARQQTDDPDAAIKTFDLFRTMVQTSNGKVTISDFETVIRNMGDPAMTINDEGWMRLLPLIEQNKTAGGGNGGGGGVARVGTMIKMLSLIASGRTITNRAALDMSGANILNDEDKSILEETVADFKKISEANSTIARTMKNAGFKNQTDIAQDPMKGMWALRGGIIDYMMQDGKFEQFFGSNARRHTYDNNGNMINADGELVDEKTQSQIETMAIKRFFARSGVSNNNVTSMVTALNTTFAKRAEYSVESGKNMKSREDQLADISENWSANKEQFKSALINLAVAFTPLIEKLALGVGLLAEFVNKVAEFTEDHPFISGAIASTVALVAFGGAVKLIVGIFAGLFKGFTLFKAGASGASAAVSGATASTSLLSRILGKLATILPSFTKFFGWFGTAGASAATKVSGALGGLLARFGLVPSVTGGAVKSMLGLLGKGLNWAGWLYLAGKFGWAVGTWISDLKVGGIKIGEHMQNLINIVANGIARTINSVQTLWNDFVAKFWRSSEQVRQRKLELENQRAQIDASESSLKVRAAPKTSDDFYIRDIRREIEQNPTKYKTLIKQEGGVEQAAKFAFEQRTKKLGYDNLGFSKLPEHSEYKKLQQANAITATKDADAKHGKNPNVDIKGFAPSPSDFVNPEISAPTGFEKANSGTRSAGGSNGGSREPRSSIEEQNPFLEYAYGLRNSGDQVDFRIQELLGQPVSYEEQARQDFINRWKSGEFDVNRDQKRRLFVKQGRSFNKDTGWSDDDLDTSMSYGGISGDQAILDAANKLKDKAKKEALEFVASKLGESGERFDDSLLNLDKNADVNSNQTSAMRRQFAKFEQKQPEATKGEDYNFKKQQTLLNLAGGDFAEMLFEIRKANKQHANAFIDDEVKNSRYLIDLKIEEENAKYKAVVDNLELQLKALESKGAKETQEYKDAQKVFEQGQKDMTDFQAYQQRLREQETRSSFDRQMANWRDYELNITNTLGSYGEKGMTDIWDILNGDKSLDVRGFASEMLKSVGSDLFKSAAGSLSKTVMGEGEGTSIFDYGRALLKGDAVSGDGKLGDWLNKIRGLSTPTAVDGVAINDPTERNTNATTLNTTALNNLSSALGGKTVPISPTQANKAGATVLGDSLPEWKKDEVAVEPDAPQAEQTTWLGSIKSGFASLFSSSGEGGIFTSIKSGFMSLFSGGSSMMSKIGSSFSGAFGGIMNAVGQYFGGGSSNSSKAINAAGAAYQGYQNGGGFLGAAIGAGVSLFAKNGAAFDNTVHAFANGGAFTNGLYDSPTLFKFANGGKFGVMGEAGPEAVMPLSRDGSGRLGVTVNGASGESAGGSTLVDINISVTNNGNSSSETSSGDTATQWGEMASRVKSVVQEELQKQQRNGGMLKR